MSTMPAQRSSLFKILWSLVENANVFHTQRDHEARQKYLDQYFDNGTRSHLCYSNFLIFANRGQPIGRGNRFAAMCVVGGGGGGG